MITYTITRGAVSGNSGSLSGTYAVTGSAEISITESYNASSVNVPQGIAFGATGSNPGSLVAVMLLSTSNMTIKTNSSGSPQDTISLAANVPIEWDSQSGLACPFAGAVTEMFVSCTGASTLQVKVLTF